MKKNKAFIIPLVVYPFDILVSVQQTNEEFLKTITEHLPPSILNDLKEDTTILNMRATNNGRTINLLEGGQTIIRLKRYPKNCFDYGVIAHEVFHAVEFIFHRIGLKHSIESGEAYAYLVQYITEQIYKRI